MRYKNKNNIKNIEALSLDLMNKIKIVFFIDDLKKKKERK